jgi:hypothetical protein
MNKISHNVDCVMGLQNCLLTLRIDPGPCTGTCQISSDDVNQVVGNKGEDATDIKVEEDPWPATSMGIKTEPAVSSMCARARVSVCVSVCIQVNAHWTSIVQTVCRIRCEWII